MKKSLQHIKIVRYLVYTILDSFIYAYHHKTVEYNNKYNQQILISRLLLAKIVNILCKKLNTWQDTVPILLLNKYQNSLDLITDAIKFIEVNNDTNMRILNVSLVLFQVETVCVIILISLTKIVMQ